MKVEQLMTREVKVCRADDSVNRAAQLMWEYDCGFIPVISSNGDGAVVGVVTDRDIAMATYTQGKAPIAIPITVAMSHEVIACHTADGISQAEALMRDHHVRRVPVLDQKERLVGVLSLNDIAREVQREAAGTRRAEVTAEALADTLAEICRPRGTYQVTVAA